MFVVLLYPFCVVVKLISIFRKILLDNFAFNYYIFNVYDMCESTGIRSSNNIKMLYVSGLFYILMSRLS